MTTDEPYELGVDELLAHAWPLATLLTRLGKTANIKITRISPHSLRHAYATPARDAGARREDIQDVVDHADPRTTRRYDRDRQSLDRLPGYTLAAYLTGH